MRTNALAAALGAAVLFPVFGQQPADRFELQMPELSGVGFRGGEEARIILGVKPVHKIVFRLSAHALLFVERPTIVVILDTTPRDTDVTRDAEGALTAEIRNNPEDDSLLPAKGNHWLSVQLSGTNLFTSKWQIVVQPDADVITETAGKGESQRVEIKLDQRPELWNQDQRRDFVVAGYATPAEHLKAFRVDQKAVNPDRTLQKFRFEVPITLERSRREIVVEAVNDDGNRVTMVVPVLTQGKSRAK